MGREGRTELRCPGSVLCALAGAADALDGSVSQTPAWEGPLLPCAEGFRLVFAGQWIAVGLPVSQQRVLDGIENGLEGGEPRLRSMFAIFTRLTRDEGAPWTEALRAETRLRRLRRIWPAGGLTPAVRAIIAVPLILGLVMFCVFMAINSSGTQGCRPGPGMARIMSCQSAQQPVSHS
jgi:hypothetical protein